MVYLRYNVVFYRIRVSAICRGVCQILTIKVLNICKMQGFYFLSPKPTKQVYHIKAFLDMVFYALHDAIFGLNIVLTTNCL